MEIKINNIYQLFINIERTDIDENQHSLVSDGIIDSIDIINLTNEIEKFYNIKIDAELITPDNFENFEAIKNMISSATKNI
ncbi:acyl carrier protein [Campylobacter lari]